jgi:hypothetical protein
MIRLKVGQRWMPRHDDGRYAKVIGVSNFGQTGKMAIWDAGKQLVEQREVEAAQWMVAWRLDSAV